MSANKKRNWLTGAISMLVGLGCALVLAVVFYGAMAYQLIDAPAQGTDAIEQRQAGALLALPGAQLLAEETAQQTFSGVLCTVTTRAYRTDAGLRAEAISAAPAAYVARLSDEGWTAQLITGFTLAGLDAVCSTRSGESMLSAREGDWIYMLKAAADEQTLYALGAGAYLE